VKPDSVLIAEIVLFAAGFSNSRTYAKKIDLVYRLATLQLSKQDHYDFGLRALGSTLKAVANRRRRDPTVPDDSLLLSMLRDLNLPKLAQIDIPVFLCFFTDVFAGVESLAPEVSSIRDTVAEEMQAMGLQPDEKQINKIIQLHETKLMRHGVMVIGMSGSGKTTAWKVLQNALSKTLKTVDERPVAVKTYVINPKASHLSELFGAFKPNTAEWQDGNYTY
jgi:dynein heavy chain